MDRRLLQTTSAVELERRSHSGYGWWMGELAGYQAYYAWGCGGHYTIIVPDLQLVVATTSSSTIAKDRCTHRRTVFGRERRTV